MATRAFKNVAVAAARAADEKKGEAITLLHVSKTSPLADFLLVVTATSRPHLETLEHEIEKSLTSAFGVRVFREARPKSDSWRVLDFGGLIVHLMTAEARGFYQLEKLHHGAPLVRWQEEPKAHKPARGRKVHA